ncbi:hypothetical protein QN362_07975 [Actimicrobium sp. CCC2.4]|uniref:porin n=1 Tax=Actimicrobium sp. CCC2.4 TaxID=3048606 RepID=UPI002AC8BBA6|nr:porin [Actimicrobium sp. CCC2.4]MEB0135267.1 hypothetical protein [Actimicrobium sp. CCC2.4]WPX31059.1 hypothetical protein RHM62_12435 [Actimicrobium sp. CCC2.4]
MSSSTDTIFPTRLTSIALSALLLAASSARADDSATSTLPTFMISGFGTIGMARSSEHRADYTNSPSTKPNGTGISRNWSPDLDTRLGLQIAATITPSLSAVFQVISQQQYDNSYRPTVEWANIKYAITPDLTVRVGRIAFPTFLAGDYRNVGYAMPWVRPPVELYSRMIPMTANDGIDASYRSYIGEATNTLQLSYGSDVLRSPGLSSPSKVQNIAGLFNTFSSGPATLRVSYQRGRIIVPSSDAFFNLYRQFGPAGTVIADNYSFDHKPISFLSLGASYDPGDWFLMSEWGSGKFSSVLGNQTAWYASGGYRLGTWTPYLTYSTSKKHSPTSDPGLDPAGLPAFAAGSAGALNGALNALLRPSTSATISLGTRWDVGSNVALKLQLDHTRPTAGSSAGLIHITPGYRPDAGFNVLSLTVDFVF